MALPSIGFLLDTWLGAVIGLIVYVVSGRFARTEEAKLASSFGTAWDDYCDRVRLPWL